MGGVLKENITSREILGYRFALLAFIHLGYTVLYILTAVYNQQARKAILVVYSESDMPCVPAYYIIYTRFWYSYSSRLRLKKQILAQLIAPSFLRSPSLPVAHCTTTTQRR
jgi:hypothetical protein